MKKSVLVLALLVIGLIIGYFVYTSLVSCGSSTPTATTTTAAGATTTTAAGETTTTAAGETTTTAAGATTTTAAGTTTTVAANTITGTVAVPASALSSFSIAGRIAAFRARIASPADNTPVAGATVTAQDPITGDTTGSTDTTGSDGSFTLENVDDTVIIQATKSAGDNILVVQAMAEPQTNVEADEKTTLSAMKCKEVLEENFGNVFENLASFDEDLMDDIDVFAMYEGAKGIIEDNPDEFNIDLVHAGTDPAVVADHLMEFNEDAFDTAFVGIATGQQSEFNAIANGVLTAASTFAANIELLPNTIIICDEEGVLPPIDLPPGVTLDLTAVASESVGTALAPLLTTDLTDTPSLTVDAPIFPAELAGPCPPRRR